MLRYEILGSSSREGNCVLIDDVMVDIGVSFKKVEEALYRVNFLLVTHIHQDHLKVSTLKKMHKLFPNIIIISNYEVYNFLKNEGIVINIISPSKLYQTSKYAFKAFTCYHNTLTYGYIWKSIEDKNILYVTDTASLKNVPKLPYDFLFIESNYDEQKLEDFFNEAKKKGGYDRSEENLRHLSTKQARFFYYTNRRDKNSQFIELHKSSKFY